jgi:FixJ family two-component response regulator
MKLGALDLIEKPADIATIVERIGEAAARKVSLEDRDIQRTMSDILRKKGW